MLKLTFVAENNIAVLGITAVAAFFKAMDNQEGELDAVQTVDDDFIQKIESMKSQPFGFTQEFKRSFVSLLEENLGKKILLTEHWITDSKTQVAKDFMQVVALLNEGIGIKEAIDAVFVKNKVEEMQSEEPKKEEQTVELVGYLKYPKEWSGKEHQSMFVVGNDDHSSIQLFFPLTGDKIEDNNYLIRLANMESQKVQVLVEAFEIGLTSKGKKNMSVVSIVDYKEYKKMKGV